MARATQLEEQDGEFWGQSRQPQWLAGAEVRLQDKGEAGGPDLGRQTSYVQIKAHSFSNPVVPA